MHKTIVIGKIAREPRETPFKNNVCINFQVVSTKKYLNDQGQTQEYTAWFDCAIWRKNGAAPIADQLKQGSVVMVEGEAGSRTYQPKDTSLPMKSSLTLTVAHFEVISTSQPQQNNQQPNGNDEGDF